MFPQYCGATTRRGVRPGERGAAPRCATCRRCVSCPTTTREPAYIEALAAASQDHRRESGATQHLLMSFHGIPERFVDARRSLSRAVRAHRGAAGAAARPAPTTRGACRSSRASAARAGCSPTPARCWRRCRGAACKQRERDLPGFRRRLPGDARGNRHGESRRVPRRRRRARITTSRRSMRAPITSPRCARWCCAKPPRQPRATRRGATACFG